MPTLSEVRAAERRALAAANEADELRAKLQVECQHPLGALTFSSGACTSYRSDGVEYQVTIRCAICDYVHTVWVKFHND